MNQTKLSVLFCMVVTLLSSLALAGSGPDGFPLPNNAVKVGEESNEDGSLRFVTYNLKCAWQKCADELEGLFKKEGWKIDSKEISPRHSQVKFTVTKDKNMVQAQVSQEGDASQLFLDLGY